MDVTHKPGVYAHTFAGFLPTVGRPPAIAFI